MFEHYKSRMAHRGANMSEMLRMQSNMVIEQTWDRDPNFRRVYVVKVSSGLPKVTKQHELIDVKFNVETYQKLTSDEPAYLLQFRHGAEKHNPDIAVGSYVYMEDEDGEWKWWLLVALDERPQFRQYHILETNWTLKWIVDNKIHTCLAVQRYQNSYSSGLQSGSRITGVDDMTAIWVPTNSSTQTIGYNQRFLISDVGRTPALCYEVSKISDTSPIGLIKFSLAQTTFNESTDNVDLMIADYWADIAVHEDCIGAVRLADRLQQKPAADESIVVGLNRFSLRSAEIGSKSRIGLHQILFLFRISSECSCESYSPCNRQCSEQTFHYLVNYVVILSIPEILSDTFRSDA